MGQKFLLGCALHIAIASSLVLNSPQSLPEIPTNPSIAPDASSNVSAIQIAHIPAGNSQPSASGPPTSTLSFANITAPADNATLTAMSVECTEPFPTPGAASSASCEDAYEFTKGGPEVISLGDRAAGDWDVPLPVRFLSDDGHCLFDYDVAEPGQVDHSALSVLKFAARTLFDICLKGNNRGGVATGLGQHGRLTVSLKSYRPNVQCTSTNKPPAADKCRFILADMPVSKALQVFGNTGTRGIDVQIPYTMGYPGLSCVIKVRMTAGLTSRQTIRTSWYNIWQKAVALTDLCAETGKNGSAYIYGGSERQPVITVSVDNEARQGLSVGSLDDVSQQRKE